MAYTINQVGINDLEEVESIYSYARSFMKEIGNEDQWGDVYPSRQIILNDINNGVLYKIEEDNKITGVFAFIIGDAPTYSYIEDGAWLNDNEYGTIHRIASAKDGKDTLNNALSFIKTKILNVRIDTHRNNVVMRHLLEKFGFTYCGIIYIENGDERLAFQKILG